MAVIFHWQGPPDRYSKSILFINIHLFVFNQCWCLYDWWLPLLGILWSCFYLYSSLTLLSGKQCQTWYTSNYITVTIILSYQRSIHIILDQYLITITLKDVSDRPARCTYQHTHSKPQICCYNFQKYVEAGVVLIVRLSGHNYPVMVWWWYFPSVRYPVGVR